MSVFVTAIFADIANKSRVEEFFVDWKSLFKRYYSDFYIVIIIFLLHNLFLSLSLQIKV